MQSGLHAIVRPSVRPSHRWISQKRLKLGAVEAVSEDGSVGIFLR